MSNIQVFNFEQKNVRTAISDDGEPLFMAIDVCTILGYKNSRKAISDHCKENGVTKRYIIDELGRKQEATFIVLSLNLGSLKRSPLKHG